MPVLDKNYNKTTKENALNLLSHKLGKNKCPQWTRKVSVYYSADGWSSVSSEALTPRVFVYKTWNIIHCCNSGHWGITHPCKRNSRGEWLSYVWVCVEHCRDKERQMRVMQTAEKNRFLKLSSSNPTDYGFRTLVENTQRVKAVLRSWLHSTFWSLLPIFLKQ